MGSRCLLPLTGVSVLEFPAIAGFRKLDSSLETGVLIHFMLEEPRTAGHKSHDLVLVKLQG